MHQQCRNNYTEVSSNSKSTQMQKYTLTDTNIIDNKCMGLKDESSQDTL